MNPIVSISHFQQSAEGYCLSACVRMVLTHLGLERSEAEVSQMLLSPCHCEERFLRRSNLLLAAWGLLRSATKKQDTAVSLRGVFLPKQSPASELGIALYLVSTGLSASSQNPLLAMTPTIVSFSMSGATALWSSSQ